MKKILSIFLLMIMCAAPVFFTSCCSHEWEEATCTAPKTCKICGAKSGQPLGHLEYRPSPACKHEAVCLRCHEVLKDKEKHSQLLSGKCRYCDEYIAGWEILFYVDEFKNPTNHKYIENEGFIKGTFSNSATDNSKLSVDLLIEKNSVNIMLWEYESYKVKNSSAKYDIAILKSNGSKIDFTAIMYSDRIEVPKTQSKQIIDLLLTGENLKFYIKEIDKYSSYPSRYNFEVEAKNFANIYNEYLGIKKISSDTKPHGDYVLDEQGNRHYSDGYLAYYDIENQGEWYFEWNGKKTYVDSNGNPIK